MQSLLLHQLHNSSSDGQTLAEVVVVIALVVLLVTGLVAGTTSSISTTADTKNTTEAIKYAREGVEIARFERDRGWSAFAAKGATLTDYCVGSDKVFVATVTGCDEYNITNTHFIRSITLELIPADAGSPEKMRVTVTVLWEESSEQQTTYLTQWQ